MTTPSDIDPTWFRRGFLLLLVVGISLLFLSMIETFITTLLLAAVFSGLMYPLFRRFVVWFRGRRALASAATLLVFVFLLVGPLSAFFGIVTAQALEVSQTVGPWVEEQIRNRDQLDELLRRLPFVDFLAPYADQILARVGEIAGRTGAFVVEQLAAFTRRTVLFLFLLFVMLYAMFFFLKDGRRVLERILYYMPLSSEDENRMLDKFVSVTRATVKGTLVIGLVQGALAGAAFAVVGIPGWAFWGTIMAVLSILPGVGTALVWVPAVIYLVVIGRTGAALGLGLWCAAVVGTVDNLLRPRLVGKDTELPDLLILLGTLGGVVLFGAAGIIIGPIVAALFVTVWEIYGVAFREFLPTVEMSGLATVELLIPEEVAARKEQEEREEREEREARKERDGGGGREAGERPAGREPADEAGRPPPGRPDPGAGRGDPGPSAG